MKRLTLCTASWCAAACLAVACHSSAPSPAKSELDAIPASPASQRAQKLAPQTFAEAEKLRNEANAEEDPTLAAIRAEEARAAYEQAQMEARALEARERRDRLRSERREQLQEIERVKASREQAEATLTNLERRTALVREVGRSSATPDDKPVSPERLEARRQAARSITMEAQLLCVARRLLDPTTAESTLSIEKQIETLRQRLGGKPEAAWVTDALSLRGACLAQLTLLRRPAFAAKPAASPTHQLLGEVAASGAEHPYRDDRGVVASLRDLGSGKLLRPEAAELLQRLGRVAQAHGDFPLQVVFHGYTSQEERNLAPLVVAQLQGSGAKRVEWLSAGKQLPLVLGGAPDAANLNRRVEVVFVSPAY